MVPRGFLPFLVLGLVACGDGVIGPEDIAGTYTLQSVNGESLPRVIFEFGDSHITQVTAGSITFNQDMTCSRSIAYTETVGSTVRTVTQGDVCTYTLVNGAVTLTWDSDGSTDSGSIVGSQLTLNATQDDVLIFRK